MSIAIYKITNLLNQKSYIGQSINIEQRIKKHISSKDKYPIHEALRKYPLENFEFSVLEECPKELLNEREEYWISYYDSYKNGYNCTAGGDNVSDTCKKPVKQYDLSGNYIQTYESQFEAARNVGTDARYISNCCLQKNNTAKGYQWCFVGDENSIQINPKDYAGNLKISVNQFSLEGKFIQTFLSIADAENFLNKNCGKEIVKCCKKELQSAANYQWRFAEEGQENIKPYQSRKVHTTIERKVGQYDKDGNLIAMYENAVLAAEAVGLAKGGNSAILRVCNGKQKTSKGFFWKYLD